jgi:hypothetical protein
VGHHVQQSHEFFPGLLCRVAQADRFMSRRTPTPQERRAWGEKAGQESEREGRREERKGGKDAACDLETLHVVAAPPISYNFWQGVVRELKICGLVRFSMGPRDVALYSLFFLFASYAVAAGGFSGLPLLRRRLHTL